MGMLERSTHSELSAQAVLDALHHPTAIIDASATIVSSNHAWKIFCQNPDGFHGKNYFNVCSVIQEQDEDGRTTCQQGVTDVLGGKRALFRFDYPLKDRHYTMSATPVTDPFHGVMIVHTDSTDMVQANAQLTMLLEAPLDALMVVDQRGLIQMVNKQMETMFGYSRDELFGQTMEILLPHRFRRQHRQHVAGFLEKPRLRPMGTGLELYGLHKNGAEFPIEISLNPLQSSGTPLVSAAIRNVSERKQSEVQFARLARILESSSNEIYLFDANTLCFTFVNQGAIHNLAYTMDELSSLTPLDVQPEFNVTSFEKLLRPLRDGMKGSLQFSTLHQRKDLSRYPVDVYLQFFRHETPPLFAAVVTDTTERNQTQKALQESRQRVAMHVENTPLAVLEWRSSDGIITAWNPAAERLFGYSADEMVGKRRADVILPEELKSKLEPVLRGNITTAGSRSTNRNITKDGRVLTCEWYNTLLDDVDGEGVRVAALALDVTARQRAINELLSVQEEERSRIARDLHDHVGQLLTGLNLGLSSAIEKPDNKKLGDLKILAATILDDVRRISRDLRPALLDELGLESSVKRFARELSAQSELNVDILMRVPDKLGRDVATVIYRVTQEALTNVVRHAKATHASVVVTTSENAVQLIIEDNGVGFDPTSVAASEHVGLSSMRERIELVGGTFTVESLPGNGTTISAKLPLL
ncbi:MAG: PAS domain S-box protein [Trueperaceae bacterium]